MCRSIDGKVVSPRWALHCAVWLMACGVATVPAFAISLQDGPPDHMGPAPMEGRRPPMERAFHFGPPGRWWNNPQFAKSLGLTADQQAKMDTVFQQSRTHLIDMSASLQKEEVNMEPLLSADQPDESKVLSQIDRIASARAELEKANARMLLGLRRILTQDQWKKLQADDPAQHPHGGPAPMPPHGPDGM